MKLKTASLLKNIANYIALLLAGGALLLQLDKTIETCMLIGAVVLVVLSVVLAVAFYRCPHCKAPLGNGLGGLPEVCPRCKGRLDE